MTRQWTGERAVDPAGVRIACTLRPGWIAIALFISWRGALHLTELTVTAGQLPNEAQQRPSETPAGRWFAERGWLEAGQQLAALPRTPSPHAIHARLLRDVPLTEMFERAERAAAAFAEFGQALKAAGSPERDWAHLVDLSAAEDELTAARLDYLRVAQRYAALAGHLATPVKAISDELGISAQQVHDRLRWARANDYLTKPGQGRRGGQLTDLGAALAARHLSTPQKGESDG